MGDWAGGGKGMKDGQARKREWRMAMQWGAEG